MGDKVTIPEALIVTVVSMIVVFLVLAIIAWLIGLLKKVGEENEKKLPKSPKKEEQPVLIPDKIQEEVEDEEELIAVITAAIAASMGLRIPEIKIKSIRRTNQITTAWREMAKQEHFYGKL